MRSDPVKRKQINAQKREAMRRLNERRKAEKDKRERLLVACAAANTLTEQSPPSQVELQDIVHQYENCIEDWDNQRYVRLAKDLANPLLYKKPCPSRSTHEDLPTFQESYQPTEPQVVMKTEISTSQELSPVDGQAQNDLFPFASGIANCLEGEDLRKFISYIEDSAQMYLKVSVHRLLHININNRWSIFNSTLTACPVWLTKQDSLTWSSDDPRSTISSIAIGLFACSL